MADDQIAYSAVLDTGNFDAGMEVITGALRRVGEIALDTFIAAGQAVVGFAADSFQSALDAEVAMTRIEQVIESTGGAAGLTADDVAALGVQFQNLAGGTDDTVIAIEEMALRMGNISKDEMPAFIQTTLDLAAATGQDAVSAARLLAQAQEDPISALSRFRRMGILFTEDQQAQIKAMVESGDAAGAFALVMGRVTEATGGAAAAQAGTLAGQWEIFKNTISEAGEAVATALLPALHEFTDQVLPILIPFITQLATDFGNVVAEFIAGESPLTTIQDKLAEFQPIIQAVSDVWNNTLLPALQGAWAWIQAELIPLWNEIFGILMEGAQTALPQLTDFWNNVLMPALQNFWAWTQANILPLLSQLWDWIKINLPVAIQTLVDFYNNVWLPAQIAITTWIIDNVFPMLGTLFDWLQTNIPIAIQTVSDFWNNTLLPAITAVWAFIEDPLMPLFEALEEFLSATFTLATTALAGLWENVLQPALEKVWDFLDKNVFPLFRELGAWLQDTFGPIVQGLVDGALAALSGVWDGIVSGIQGAIKWLGDMADKINSITLPDWLTPGSPTPFETGLRGITAAMRDLNRMGLTALVSAPAPAYAMASPSYSTSSQTNYNYAPSYGSAPNQPSRDFATMRALGD